ncbi:MAG: HIT domain-containing protein [Pseudomonadota bacterium]|nr:HIT domain-containing protein [Pseudomonadota bacterium]
MNFKLVPALQQKDFICDLPFSRVLMEDNADYPWVFLVPRKNGVKNMLDLTTEERLTLMREIEVVERTMNSLFQPAQTNVAMIGNKTPQLHVHIICRFENDPLWPDTVWGCGAHPYDPNQKQKVIQQIKEEIIKCQKLLS